MNQTPEMHSPQTPNRDGDGSQELPRLIGDIRLPEYAHVPGCTPRPQDGVAPAIDDFRSWATCVPYLRGIDLFNHGFYWEAHESWEAVWIASGRRGPCADFVKGLIKLAAALVKAREGRPVGVVRHARRASQLFQEVSAATNRSTVMMGLDIGTLDREARRIAAAPDSVVDPRQNVGVVRVTPFLIQPVVRNSPPHAEGPN